MPTNSWENYYRLAPVFPPNAVIPFDAVKRIPDPVELVESVDITAKVKWLKSTWQDLATLAIRCGQVGLPLEDDDKNGKRRRAPSLGEEGIGRKKRRRSPDPSERRTSGAVLRRTLPSPSFRWARSLTGRADGRSLGSKTDLVLHVRFPSPLSIVVQNRAISNWRREGDSNPRPSFLSTRFPIVLLRPTRTSLRSSVLD